VPTLAGRIQTRLKLVKEAALTRSPGGAAQREDMDAAFWALQRQVEPYTMTTPERLFAFREAVRYVLDQEIAGDIVECGVWRGGSSMMAALALREKHARRHLWLFDTFDGMPEPGEHDRTWDGQPAADELAAAPREAGARTTWAYATLQDVQANMRRTSYPTDHITYVSGKVEDTIPAQAPRQIAILRLDTDWYESTLHELEHLWPRLASGGVLIIDDYGHWQGARKAVDEFFDKQAHGPMLHRVDYTGRTAIKP
jgi:O-methyltransferase